MRDILNEISLCGWSTSAWHHQSEWNLRYNFVKISSNFVKQSANFVMASLLSYSMCYFRYIHRRTSVGIIYENELYLTYYASKRIYRFRQISSCKNFSNWRYWTWAMACQSSVPDRTFVDLNIDTYW